MPRASDSARLGTFEFVAPLWLHSGDDGWHFVTVPPEVSDEIEDLGRSVRRGFGSLRVVVTVGGTTWRTSLFPSAAHEAFLLPVKKPVRTGEGLTAGSDVRVSLELADL